MVKLGNVQSINIEEIPNEISITEVWPDLAVNGGNVLSVQKDSKFGRFLAENGFVFQHPRIPNAEKTWGWIVVFR